MLSLSSSEILFCGSLCLLQSGYIDGPILKTFHTNLVVMPAMMEYMQYIFISLGLATILGAVILKTQDKVCRVCVCVRVRVRVCVCVRACEPARVCVCERGVLL